ncbi:DNA replication protein [Moorella thermoacetica Y72]|nr:DNA replication protein [Moorella thermoacetica Y72]
MNYCRGKSVRKSLMVYSSPCSLLPLGYKPHCSIPRKRFSAIPSRKRVAARPASTNSRASRITMLLYPWPKRDRRKADIVMIGNPGTRKTHLSIALGLKACVHGYSVRFFTAAGLVTKLAEAQDEKRLGRMLKELSRVNLLIVDELSYISLPRQGAELLFQVISERSERGSIIINTNLDFSKWEEIFGDRMLAAALVDRVTFKSHILNMNAESYRLKQLQKARAS